jgi:hypothetical protein
MDRNEIPHDLGHLGVLSGVSKAIFEPVVRSAQTVNLSPNGPKRPPTWASSPRSTIGCVQKDFWGYGMFGANRASILHRYLHCLQTDRNEIPHDPRHLGVLSGVFKIIFEPVVYSTQNQEPSLRQE